jgi:hypothetical protein
LNLISLNFGYDWDEVLFAEGFRDALNAISLEMSSVILGQDRDLQLRNEGRVNSRFDVLASDEGDRFGGSFKLRSSFGKEPSFHWPKRVSPVSLTTFNVPRYLPV